jgi:FkbM family methyltransferase
MQELMTSMNNWYGSENWDAERFGPYHSSIKDSAVSKFNQFFRGNFGIVPMESSSRQSQYISRIRDFHEGLSWLYELLADEPSKQTLIKVWAYRLLGPKKVKLPHNTPSYWSQREATKYLIKGSGNIKVKFPKLTMKHMSLEELGYPIEIYYAASGLMATFILGQYEYRKRKPEIKAEEGDYVIDGGGCWGDTTLYFSHRVGEGGKVYSFEFNSENLEVLNKNLNLNPALLKRIEVVPKALWGASNEVIRYSANGPATSLAQASGNKGQGSLQVTTVSIDDFVRERELPRVDFIKMDIEGAELNALKGALETIRRFRPKLAISIYHRDVDFIEIPAYLNNLALGYVFYLDHFTIYGEETILFATPNAG